MLYTRKGDMGTTCMYDSNAGVRISKCDTRVEALGAIDELNSYIGYCRAQTTNKGDRAVCLAVQHDLFTIQAQLAGVDQCLPRKRIHSIEQTIHSIEQNIPPITSFCVPGQTLVSASFDIARTLARRAERRVVALYEMETLRLNEITLAYLNRLSSLLYALARGATHRAGVHEISPEYRGLHQRNSLSNA